MDGEWEDIKTAPRDGSSIEVRHGKWAPYHVRWKDHRWQPIEYNAPPNPTHWKRPLPAPPADTSTIDMRNVGIIPAGSVIVHSGGSVLVQYPDGSRKKVNRDGTVEDLPRRGVNEDVGET